MATRAIFALLSPAQRALIPFFERALGQGLSANRAIQTVFRAPGGPGIRRSTGLELARVIQPRIQFQRRLQNVGESFLPDPSRLPTALGRIVDPIVARFRVTTTGGDELFFSLGRSTVSTRSVLESELADKLASDPSRYPLDVSEVRLVDLVQAGEAGVIPR